MMDLKLFLSSVFLIALSWGQLEGQIVLRGKVMDATSGDPLPGANVFIEGNAIGTVTDIEGEYELKTSELIPFKLVISYAGYVPENIEITNGTTYIRINLKPDIALEEIIIVESRVPGLKKESPYSSSTLDLIDFKQTPSIGAYESAGTLPEVDLIAPSFGFKVINTRGFNSTSPVRSLQIIDGVDNQAPGLNFSLGNFLGTSELDLQKLEIIAGATGAYYGPAAFNGVISMTTKNPFIHTGLSAYAKGGERNFLETAFRFADVIKNKSEVDVFAYKLNLFVMRADDWEANNYDPVTNSRDTVLNPGRYDAVNIYGDEYYVRNDFIDYSGLCRDMFVSPGVRTFYRTGYREVDLVDYNTSNYKANLALHLRTKPALEFESPSIILSSSYGAGTTIYQGDNRFSLRNIQFLQNKIEFRKDDKFFIRAYHTYENAGRSYDPYFTALRLQQLSKDDNAWNRAYTNFWFDTGRIPAKMETLLYPVFPNFDCDSAFRWIAFYTDSLADWHSLAESSANSTTVRDPPGSRDFFEPGTARYDSAFHAITSKLNNEAGGTGFYDRSSLYHLSGEYIFKPAFLSEIRVGGHYRIYNPRSKGTIFSDTSGTVIQNSEISVYAGAKKKFFNQKLIATATLRLDKNENLNLVYTPAASLIFSPDKQTYFRFSYSSAVRNPTLTDQYLYLNVGPAILSGHVDKVDSLITIESFRESVVTGDIYQLKYFDIDPIKPEKVSTFETGIRTTLLKKVNADITYYRNSYRDFLGYLIGISADVDLGPPLPPLPSFSNIQAYRYSANSKNKVTTHGLSIGLHYYLSHAITLQGNYSYNALRKTVEDDPIIPAYNTPEHKSNLGVAGRDIHISNSVLLRKVGFNIQYKWVNGFRFEGSPQFSGYIPSYGVMDVQINTTIEKSGIIIKAGATNLLQNKHFEVYGGPRIGRMAYVNISYRF